MGCHVDMSPHHLIINSQPLHHTSRSMKTSTHLFLLNLLLHPISHWNLTMDLSRVWALDFESTQYSSLTGDYCVLRILLEAFLSTFLVHFVPSSSLTPCFLTFCVFSLFCCCLLSLLGSHSPYLALDSCLEKKASRSGLEVIFPGLHGHSHNLSQAFGLGCKCSFHTCMEHTSSPLVIVGEEINPASTPSSSSDYPMPNPGTDNVSSPQA